MTACKMHERDAEVVAKATHYTASAFLGSGKYDTREFPTCNQARATALDMANDRPVLVYAVYRSHFALIETVKPGEQLIMNQFHLLNLGKTPIVIKQFDTDASLQAAWDKTPANADIPHPTIFMISAQDDLKALSMDQMLAVYNFLTPAAKFEKFPKGTDASGHVWSMLSTGKPLDIAPGTDGSKPAADKPAADKPKAEAKKAPTPAEAAEALMLKAAKKKDAADKAKAAKDAEDAKKKAAKAAEDTAKKEKAKTDRAAATAARKKATADAKAAAKAARDAEKLKPKAYLQTSEAIPVRAGTSLEKILRLLIAGTHTLTEIAKLSGMPTNLSNTPEEKALHRIRHVLYRNHGIRHTVDDKGIYHGMLPDGKTLDEMIKQKAEPKPKAEKKPKTEKKPKAEPKPKAEKKTKATTAKKAPAAKKPAASKKKGTPPAPAQETAPTQEAPAAEGQGADVTDDTPPATEA